MRSLLRPAGLLAIALLSAAAWAGPEDAKNRPPAFVRGIFAAVPPNITHVASVGSGRGVLLFYDKASMLPPGDGPDEGPRRESFVLRWDAGAWSAPRPFAHVSQALTVGGESWALTNGGYLTSRDGASWSRLNPQPDWKEPFGCVLEGRPHVFWIDGGALRETSFDGARWLAPRVVPGDWQGRGEAFPFGSGPQAAALDGRIHLFMLSAGRKDRSLQDFTIGASGASGPREVGPAESFALAESADGLHLFYKDMRPATPGAASLSGMLAMATEMQSRMVRTSHRVFDGRNWSEPESIVTGQTVALTAARTDDALWLLGSAMSLITRTVRRDGRWGPLEAVPGTSTAAFSLSSPLFRRMALIWLILAVPMTVMFALLVWGVSAAIESARPVVLDLSGARVRCATLFRRAAAHFVDGLILWAGQMALSIPFMGGGWGDPAAMMSRMAGHFFAIWAGMMLAMLGSYFAYFTVCEARWGRTPGKRLLGIRVIADDGTPCTWRSAAIRNLLRVVDAVPNFLPGVLAFAFGKKHQRLGDMAAGTLVVSDAEPA